MQAKVDELLALMKSFDEIVDSLNDSWCQLTSEEQGQALPLMQRAQDAIKTFKGK